MRLSLLVLYNPVIAFKRHRLLLRIAVSSTRLRRVYRFTDILCTAADKIIVQLLYPQSDHRFAPYVACGKDSPLWLCAVASYRRMKCSFSWILAQSAWPTKSSTTSSTIRRFFVSMCT